MEPATKHHVNISQAHLKYLSDIALEQKASIEMVLSNILDGVNGITVSLKDDAVSFLKQPVGNAEVTLTGEQNEALQLAVTGTDMLVSAIAGAGKTTLLQKIAEQLPDKTGLYITFNRRNADEASLRFPSNIKCKTAHQLAYQAVGHKYRQRLGKKLDGFELSRILKFSPVAGFTKTLTGEMVLGTLNNYCYSASHRLLEKHIPPEYVALFEGTVEKTYNTTMLIGYAQKAWDYLIEIDSELPITHDMYLKIWSLQNPNLNSNLILLDECQDSNGSLLNIVQSQKNSQLIYCGDEWQSIYGWRGAINAMRKITNCQKATISQSFRYGQIIADLASAVLNRTFNANIAITGSSDVNSMLTTDNCRTILFRTNLALIDKAMALYKNYRDIKIHIVGKSERSGKHDELVNLLNGAQDLINGNRTLVPELRNFPSWQDVVTHSESPGGRDLSALVRMVSMWPVRGLVETLQRISMNTEEDADIVLSTVHKSKGKQWPEVELAQDFRTPDSNMFTEEEAYLLYVAVTRASERLNVFHCDACKGLI